MALNSGGGAVARTLRAGRTVARFAGRVADPPPGDDGATYAGPLHPADELAEAVAAALRAGPLTPPAGAKTVAVVVADLPDATADDLGEGEVRVFVGWAGFTPGRRPRTVTVQIAVVERADRSLDGAGLLAWRRDRTRWFQAAVCDPLLAEPRTLGGLTPTAAEPVELDREALAGGFFWGELIIHFTEE